MRHRKKGSHLNRKSSHRKALFRNLTRSLFLHKQIKTTLPKAKQLRSFAEKLITISKNDTVHNRRLIYAKMGADKESVKILFEDLGKLYKTRPGGYTRVLKLGSNRVGDNAPMAIIQLVDYPGKKEGDKAA